MLAHPRFQFRLRSLLLAVAGLGLLFASWMFDARHDRGWIDPVTGSMKRQTTWFGIGSPIVERSAIEKWIVRRDGHYVNQWKFLHDTSKSLFGIPICFGCGRAPEIYSLSAGEFNDRFVARATDQEIGDFVAVMETGSSDQKLKAVEAATKKALSP